MLRVDAAAQYDGGSFVYHKQWRNQHDLKRLQMDQHRYWKWKGFVYVIHIEKEITKSWKTWLTKYLGKILRYNKIVEIPFVNMITTL